MRAPLPFDKKNSEDFFEVSKAINEALAVIRQDLKLEPSQANLSKISGIHRNTLRNRRWPLEDLVKIKNERAGESADESESKSEKEQKLLINVVDELKHRLAMSREEAANWFHKALAYEAEVEALKATNALLKEKLDGQQKTISELRRNYDCSPISTFVKR